MSSTRHYLSASLVVALCGALFVQLFAIVPSTVHAQTEVCNTIDFETDALGNPVSAGQIIDDEYAAWGVTFSSSAMATNPPMVFDSANPTGGDVDLGTPNEDFGGLGIGPGGDLGSPGANTIPLGNILIISEDNDPSDPDDNAGGGTITLQFTFPAVISTMVLLDIDESSAGDVIAYADLAGTNVIADVPMGALGDNSYQELDILASGVLRLDLVFPGSGGFPGLEICNPNPTAVALSDFGAPAGLPQTAGALVIATLLSLATAYVLLRRRAIA